MTVITEEQFRAQVDKTLGWMVDFEGGIWKPRAVLGPGRSGAIASVYVSHLLKVPFVPYGTELPDSMKGVLIVDTAINSGRTIRKALRKYSKNWPNAEFFYHQRVEGRVKFWYEIWEEGR